jgi:hypothetical protein
MASTDLPAAQGWAGTGEHLAAGPERSSPDCVSKTDFAENETCQTPVEIVAASSRKIAPRVPPFTQVNANSAVSGDTAAGVFFGIRVFLGLAGLFHDLKIGVRDSASPKKRKSKMKIMIRKRIKRKSKRTTRSAAGNHATIAKVLASAQGMAIIA